LTIFETGALCCSIFFAPCKYSHLLTYLTRKDLNCDALHFQVSGRPSRASRFRLFLAKFVQQMRKKLPFLSLVKNLDTAVKFGDPNVSYSTDTLTFFIVHLSAF